MQGSGLHSRIKVGQRSKKKSGRYAAIVTFDTLKEAIKARIAVDGTLWDGRRLSIRRAKTRGFARSNVSSSEETEESSPTESEELSFTEPGELSFTEPGESFSHWPDPRRALRRWRSLSEPGMRSCRGLWGYVTRRGASRRPSTCSDTTSSLSIGCYVSGF